MALVTGNKLTDKFAGLVTKYYGPYVALRPSVGLS